MANKKKKNKQKFDIKHQESLIAYFDILGYKELVKNKTFSDKEFIKNLKQMTKTTYKSKKFEHEGLSQWNIYSFSDNYAIVINYSSNGIITMLSELIYFIAQIQCDFLSIYGILIRGSITKGNVYTGKKFIYGDGLIKAYELENSVSIYPRIVIDKELVNECLQFANDTIDKIAENNKKPLPSEKINVSNLLWLFPQLVVRLIDSKDKKKLLKKYEDDDLITICNDFDGIYYIDFLQSLFVMNKYRQNIVDDYILLFLHHLTYYIKTFGKKQKLLKKYLWICIKANPVLNQLGYNNFFNKSNILKLCKINLYNKSTNDAILNMFIQEIPDKNDSDDISPFNILDIDNMEEIIVNINDEF